MLEFIKPGLETSVQDYPGRVGFWSLGIPPSGPMDSYSFQLANLAVGNDPGAAGLEIQFIGPEVRFQGDTVIAIGGADMKPKVNGGEIPLWEAVPVKAGDVLTFGFATVGCRSYLAVAGGIDIPVVMTSRSTFAKALIGGIDGGPVKAGTVLKTGEPSKPLAELAGRKIKDEVRPPLGTVWDVEVMLGPFNDWLTDKDIEQFLTYDWKVSALSDRTGYRLDGPEFEFGYPAHNKLPENGSHPSNIIDYGYNVGAVNLCGQKPIILMVDGPSLGGFINPLSVVSAAMWKVGQAKPGDIIHLRKATIEDAAAMREERKKVITEASVIK